MANVGDKGTGNYAGMEWGATKDAFGSAINGWIWGGGNNGAVVGGTSNKSGCGNHSGGGYVGEGMGAGGACLPEGGLPSGDGGSYTSGGPSGGGAGSGDGGAGGGAGGSSPSLDGLKKAANPTAVESTPVAPVGSGGGNGGLPVDVKAPEDAMGGIGFGSANPTQQLTGPGASRAGLGQRVPPSLQALLKYKVY